MKVHLVDGTYELFRQNFGRAAREPDAGPYAATTGVLASTLQLLAEGATHIGVASDHVIESFRNDMWPGYKTSAGMPPELLAQIPVVEEALVAMGVTTWAMVVHEADDALAAAAAIADADERVEQVLIVTPDKDLGQCVRGRRVVQFDRRKRELVDEDGVVAKFGVRPASIPDYLGLVGDSADGYPGIPGWGAKSAAAVLARYGHLEDIPDHAGQWDVPGCAVPPSCRSPCAPTSNWRCCSAASPLSRPTWTWARSTTGHGPARCPSSTSGPSGSANLASPSGRRPWRHPGGRVVAPRSCTARRRPGPVQRVPVNQVRTGR